MIGTGKLVIWNHVEYVFETHVLIAREQNHTGDLRDVLSSYLFPIIIIFIISIAARPGARRSAQKTVGAVSEPSVWHMYGQRTYMH